MLKGAHKIALVVGVAIILGQCTVDMVPGPWKDKTDSLRQNEAQAAFIRASRVNPRHLGKPKPKKASGWWIF